MDTAKKILYIKLEDVLVEVTPPTYYDRLWHLEQIYVPKGSWIHSGKSPIEGSVEALSQLSNLFDIRILFRDFLDNPEERASQELWLKENFGLTASRQLPTIKNQKPICGDYLIDTYDQKNNFQGENINFNGDRFRCNWKEIVSYLLSKNGSCSCEKSHKTNNKLFHKNLLS